MKTDEINIRDPFVLLHNGKYYMYGTRGKECWADQAYGLDVYVSEDLDEWSEPEEIFSRTADFPYTMNYWAPEVHEYRGKFYMFVSFKAQGVCQGTSILVSDRPDGRFVLHSDGNITPPDWECLDGTLYVSPDGTPYMVFCHEWKQTVNGEICALQLTDDLKAAVGEPALLFHATDAEWVARPAKGYVTDGPFIYHLSNGELMMIWSSFGSLGYAVGMAKARDGHIMEGWTQLKEPLFQEDGGHGMIFKTKEGRIMLALHTPNEKCKERPVFLELEERDARLWVRENMA
ncbi:MAG: glycoside hydrolase family 43 protein [Lachnospiraceae bacterium]|nr:glycoside hydrolase family 43 protein [Lachnospiraceae bacterium]